MFEIGNSLREARVRRGVDFAQAEIATKIRGKYLRALEEEQFALLPAQTYVRGFLRTYAEYLGLDGQLYVDEFNSRFVTGADDHEPRTRRSTATRPQRKNRRMETMVVLGALGAVVILTVIVISAWKTSGGNKTPPVSSLHTKTTVKRPHVKPPLLLVTARRGQTHLIVHRGSATGTVVFDGTISKGDHARAIKGTRLWVQIDTPENLRILVNGRLVRVPGSAPRVGIVTKTGWHAA